ncbi:hypothetical protein QVD17_18721 [Tagetes erecta]|uniref:Uncharacterized protein n=1 Tax=Tagetes erecta TaxID=13708 RepID=A0AAD8KIG0_TARER|nr:hypothetical protein QVD17_18721 [Tagetes erecta]
MVDIEVEEINIGTMEQNGEAAQAEKMDHVTPGQRQEQRPAEVQQQTLPPASAAPVATAKGTSGAILENAAASVSSALQSAREIISKN